MRATSAASVLIAQLPPREGLGVFLEASVQPAGSSRPNRRLPESSLFVDANKGERLLLSNVPWPVNAPATPDGRARSHRATRA